jgi:hypothetical protein
MSTPWFYIWSDAVFNKVMQNTLTAYNSRAIRSDASSLSDISKIIVECFSETTAPYLIFSVSDAIIKSDISSEISTLEHDMVFLEGPKGECQTGLMYLKNSSDVLEFWKSVTTLEESLSSFKGTWGKFSKKCLTTDNWDKISEFSFLQLVSNNYGKEFDFAEKIFTMAQYIEFQPYMEYVPEDVVPFIYKIQELLFLTHKEMKKSE